MISEKQINDSLIALRLPSNDHRSLEKIYGKGNLSSAIRELIRVHVAEKAQSQRQVVVGQDVGFAEAQN